MSTLITILILIASVILILVVLVQKSKGGGLSSGFSSSNAIMGVRKTTDVIEKTTWGLAGFIIVLCILCVMVTPKKTLLPQSQLPTIPVNVPDNTTAPDMSSETEIPGIPAPTEQPAN